LDYRVATYLDGIEKHKKIRKCEKYKKMKKSENPKSYGSMNINHGLRILKKEM